MKQIQNNDELKAFYESRGLNLEAVGKKYAYFFSCKLGMKREWLGQDIVQCHQFVNNGCLDFEEMKIRS